LFSSLFIVSEAELLSLAGLLSFLFFFFVFSRIDFVLQHATGSLHAIPLLSTGHCSLADFVLVHSYFLLQGMFVLAEETVDSFLSTSEPAQVLKQTAVKTNGIVESNGTGNNRHNSKQEGEEPRHRQSAAQLLDEAANAFKENEISNAIEIEGSEKELKPSPNGSPMTFVLVRLWISTCLFLPLPLLIDPFRRVLAAA
jgi:hypothetical protein